MQQPAPLDAGSPASPSAEAALARGWLSLLRAIEPLKHLPRTGWLDRDIASPESVAAHSWRLAVLAWAVASEVGLDADRAMAIALLHDLPEAITGDHTPFDTLGMSTQERRRLATEPPDLETWRSPAARAEKEAAERTALARLVADSPVGAGTRIANLWEEYAGELTPEARLVHQLDKLEAYLQGWEYAAEGRLGQPETLRSFQLDCARLVTEPAARALLQAIEEWAGAAEKLNPGKRTLKPE